MSFERQLAGRKTAEDHDTAPTAHDASSALRQARAARVTEKPRAWAETFFAQVQHTGLPLATLNDIVAESDTLDAAMASVAQRTAAGAGHASLRKPAQVDVAARIGAAHAKAHQHRRLVTQE